ncbi:MAG: galactokinase [Eubacterium sp.]|jgi:galactokinase|nr:galactokinase [Eubacterium sp.]
MSEQIFAAPGRIEIGGNHTDHQHGRVLTAAINLKTICKAVINNLNIIKIDSAGFGRTKIDLNDLVPRSEEKGKPASLIRGVAAWLKSNGHNIGGFDGKISSSLPAGAGLSSSAAFEILIAKVLSGLYKLNISQRDMAIAGQYAESVYFGKPCGLMDQMASSFGGLMMIDFYDSENPLIRPIDIKFSGYEICVVNTGGSHADLTSDYTSVFEEMKNIAGYFGKSVLREVAPETFYKNIKGLRRFGDRAVLRAAHFFGENARVLKQANALEAENIDEFLKLVREAGISSLEYLQNVYSVSSPNRQGLTLALWLSEKVLGGEGAFRVHGGGFAGTILAFIPESLKTEYQQNMSNVFGENCCCFLKVV